MLAARTMQGRYIEATQPGDGPWFCPECSSDLVLKAGEVVVHHFAHRAEPDCWHRGGEGLDHLQAKLAIGAAYAPYAREVRYEERIIPGRRADVALLGCRTAAGAEMTVVVEVQASVISTDELSERTDDYLAEGVGVIWAWTWSRFEACRESGYKEGAVRLWEESLYWAEVLTALGGFMVAGKERVRFIRVDDGKSAWRSWSIFPRGLAPAPRVMLPDGLPRLVRLDSLADAEACAQCRTRSATTMIGMEPGDDGRAWALCGRCYSTGDA